MRCPKCGYISFDHLETCLKCNKNISKVSSQVEGTTYNATPPSFLRFSKNNERGDDQENEIRFDNAHDDFDVIDPDLKILVGDDEETGEDSGIAFEHDFGGRDEPVAGEGYKTSGDDEMGIDLGQFEDAFAEKESVFEDNIELDLPEELADISDLSPPGASRREVARAGDEWSNSPAPAGRDSSMEFDDFQLNLDLDDLDKDFSLSSDEEREAEANDDEEIGGLSLDDLGLADLEEKPSPKKRREVDPTDMDGDLDFNLDLGDISMTKD